MNFEPTDEQWEKMKKHIKSNKYKKDDFFVFETLAVGDRIVPDRFTKIMPDLLSVMKEDAEKGVSLMLNHNWSQLGVQSIPIGKVFDARLDGPSQEGETQTLYTTQYILKDDSKVDGYSKNDIIKLIETGVLSDTSIGWGTDREAYKCSICGNCIYNFAKCQHIPGRKYIINEETNEVKQCIVEVYSPKNKHSGNNVLIENSLVFDGAYPNAMVQAKIENSNNKGEMFKVLEDKRQLSEKDIIIGYTTNNGNINLLYKEIQEKGGEEMQTFNNENENLEEVAEETTQQDTQETAQEVTEQNTETNLDNTQANTSGEENSVQESGTESAEENSNTEQMYSEKDILEKFDNICDNIEDLVKMAKEGFSNRKDVIENALNSGVHLLGNSFNKEIYVKTFSGMETKDIKELGETWEKDAKNQFSTTRVSKDKVDNENNDDIKINYNQFKTSNY